MSQSPDPPDSPPGSELRRPAEPHRGWSEGVAATPSPGVQATMHEMSERLQSVIDAAERGAEAIRSDAEERARMHVAAAQRKADRMTAERVRLIAELTDDLITQAGTIRDRSEQMVAALDDAIGSVGGNGDSRPTPRRPAEPTSQEALVHATRLAVAGSDHETIARALRERFGIANPGPIVERVLGPG